MRVTQNLFDYGETGIVALSTCAPSYGAVPADPYGCAMLWRNGVQEDLRELCTRPVDLDAQRGALASLRARLAGAIQSVHRKVDWAESQMHAGFREMPTYARQLGSDRLLLAFVGLHRPWVWRLVDLAQRSTLWEHDGEAIDAVLRSAGRRLPMNLPLPEAQIPIASGADFVEIQGGITRLIFVVGADGLTAAPWSLANPNYDDHVGSGSVLLSQPDRERNTYVLTDPRTGQRLASFDAPTRSRHWARPAACLGSDRIAIAHRGGTVDLVDGQGLHHASIRPFPNLGRTDELGIQLSHEGAWLGADGWDRYRVVDLSQMTVAEIAVPEPNITDDPDQVLHDRCVIPTRYGVALLDDAGLKMAAYATLRFEPVVQVGRRRRATKADGYLAHVDRWRRPAVSLRPSKSGTSWLYGAPDLPETDIPQHAGKPMALLARIDLANAAAVHPHLPLPQTGALYVFCAVDADGMPAESDDFNPEAIQVLWRETAASSQPPGVPVIAPRQPIKLVPHQADLPDIGSEIVQSTGLDDATLEAYRSWLERKHWADQPPGHRMGGYPTLVQRDDLDASAAAVAALRDSEPPPSARSAWRLLLQLDSHETCMWGTDSGMLYVMIRDHDLMQRDFSKIVALCEGY